MNGKGIKKLEKTIVNQVTEGFEHYSDNLIITSSRQKEAIEKTIQCLQNAQNVLKDNDGFEFVTVDLRQALNELGEITGETATDDILNNIF